MKITMSPTSLQANSRNTVIFTVETGAMNAVIGSNVRGLSFSNGGELRNMLDLEVGENEITVKCGDLNGEYSIEYFWTDYETTESGAIQITVTGGTVPLYENINFSLSPRNTTIQYGGTLLTPARIGNTISGQILDHVYNYEIERVTERGLKNVFNGAAFASQLAYKLIIYQVEYHWRFMEGWTRPTFRDHLSAISSELGIPIVFYGADFYPKTDINIAIKKGLTMNFYEVLSGNFGEIMGRLISWSADVPSMTHNLFIHNGTIYIVERGYEHNTYTPDNWAIQPTISHAIRRTQWGDSATQTIVPKQISSSDAANSSEPYSGTISWGNASLTYEDGYLIQEVNGYKTTTYTYTDMQDGKRLSMKETVDTDLNEYIRVTYSYQNSENNYYLSEELTEKFSGQDDTGVLDDTSKTIHVPLGGGWYGTTVYDSYNEEISNSVSQGAPGNKASQYTIDSQNEALKPSGSQRSMTVPLNGVARARQTYPVADLATLQKIANCLNLYEGKEEIILSGEIVGGNHIYTYDDKIVFKGETYFLVSNSVSQNFNSIRQQITAVRFVL